MMKKSFFIFIFVFMQSNIIVNAADEELEKTLKFSPATRKIVVGNNGSHTKRPQFNYYFLEQTLSAPPEKLKHADALTIDTYQSLIAGKLHIVADFTSLKSRLPVGINTLALELLPSITETKENRVFPMTEAIKTASQIMNSGCLLVIQHAPHVRFAHAESTDLLHGHFTSNEALEIFHHLKENPKVDEEVFELTSSLQQRSSKNIFSALNETLITFQNVFCRAIPISVTRNDVQNSVINYMGNMLEQCSCLTDSPSNYNELMQLYIYGRTKFESIHKKLESQKDSIHITEDLMHSIGYVFFNYLWYFKRIEQVVSHLNGLNFTDISHEILRRPSSLNGRKNVIEIRCHKKAKSQM